MIEQDIFCNACTQHKNSMQLAGVVRWRKGIFRVNDCRTTGVYSSFIHQCKIRLQKVMKKRRKRSKYKQLLNMQTIVFHSKVKHTKGPRKTTTKCCHGAISMCQPKVNTNASMASKKQEAKRTIKQQKRASATTRIREFRKSVNNE